MSKIQVLSALFFVAAALVANAHPTHYKVDRNASCYDPEPAKIYSWHVHLLYWNTNVNNTAGAYVIREKFIAEFKDRLGPQCTDLFDQNQMCMFAPDIQADGPFLTAQWAVFLKNEDFADIVPWFMQHRGNYDILVHPNSGCELEDHSWWCMWGGNPWEIDLSVMSHDEPFPWPSEPSTTNLRRVEKAQDDISKMIYTFLAEHEPDYKD